MEWTGIYSRGLGSFIALITATSNLADTGCLECDLEMRKTLEGIQAWRRAHEGNYPACLADLKAAGYLPIDGAICPEFRKEHAGASSAHQLVTSRGEGRDPLGTYEYEMSTRVLKSREESIYLPEGVKDYTRQELKAVLLRRQFYEQVPILRCISHRTAAPAGIDGEAWRNATATGAIYWSSQLWEQQWLADVPYCEREVNILFGLRGPPFSVPVAPAIPQALDLRRWSCAFGDHPWWWTYPLFKARPEWQTAADLRPFFQANHGRARELAGESWWLNGLVQLQGRLIRSENGETPFTGPALIAFEWEKKGAPIRRKVHHATWLQGTVWTAPERQCVGWLAWHYADGQTEQVPIVYGTNVARFWGDARQIQMEQGFPRPVWEWLEKVEVAGIERWLRIYRQQWINPRPEAEVAWLDFISNQKCPAAPFLIALNLYSAP